MNTIYRKIGTGLFSALLLVSCQDKDLPGSAPMQVDAPDVSQIQKGLSGEYNYDYTQSWAQDTDGAVMQIGVYKNGIQQQALTEYPSNTFTLKNLETNQLYEFLYKYSLNGALSKGVMSSFTRPGATSVSEITAEQIDLSETEDIHNLKISWNKVDDATSYILNVESSDGAIKKTEETDKTEYLVEGAKMKQSFSISVIASNADGKALPYEGSARIGGKVPAFLSIYATPEELIEKGDDDEVSAWLWFKETYSQGQYLYFGNISSYDDIQDYRMLFWLRDIETGKADDVWKIPEVAQLAASAISMYVQKGGNLLLWSHAVPYIGTIGRVKTSDLRGGEPSIGCGAGSINNDNWKMGVSANTGAFYKDYSTHQIYKGLEAFTQDNNKFIWMKGAGWTEDHNCLFFNIPAKYTEKDNTSAECYESITKDYGIYPLGTWDSQCGYISQLNVWEAKGADKAPAGFTSKSCGTVLCIGNGGCEFSMKNTDGTADKQAHPKNNTYQDNILKLAKNAIDYLMSI